jgi:hypothetical protein
MKTMIGISILLYIVIALVEWGMVGCFLAVMFSRPGRLVPWHVLALLACGLWFFRDVAMWVVFAPMQLTLTTRNPTLIDLFGGPDLSAIFRPSLGLLDIVAYVVGAALAAWIGRAVVTRCWSRNSSPTRWS